MHSISPIPPALFFDVKAKVRRGLTKLPSGSHLLAEKHLADVEMGFTDEALEIEVTFKRPIKDGDAVEFFVDTRDLKTSKTITQFCHHYKCTLLGGVELTRFRGDDTHPLAEDFSIQVRGKTLCITLDQLHGFDPKRFNRIGFTYQITREDGDAEHFFLSKSTHNLAQNPHLWTTITLEDK
ncbi:MAG: hypothetical protein SP1CHLAM54_00920 [Chlamydiia bacterium]|nr:hypothetical protein [Chlamydiia bacterium]MCH9615014.1 hypothetical protein [Chlamydiia bacterium]MCH9629935.1 hypothetical protein [Chlamydiia bacterium]